MAILVCSECGHRFSPRSRLEELSPCPECGEEDALGTDDDEPEPPTVPVPRRDPRIEARAAAAELLSELSIAAPPIDVEAICNQLGLRVERRALGDVSGELRDGRVIVNSAHHPVRQRFTIAHEIGHHRLHTRHGDPGSEAERQADAFAGALLVPPGMLRAAVADESDFDVLRRRFAVSRPALSIALDQAHLSSRVSSR
jgi:hypothetical protein